MFFLKIIRNLYTIYDFVLVYCLQGLRFEIIRWRFTQNPHTDQKVTNYNNNNEFLMETPCLYHHSIKLFN